MAHQLDSGVYAHVLKLWEMNGPQRLDGVVAHAKATGATLVLVAHARSAVAKCDFATVLEDGAVVESGPYAALAADPNSRLNAALDAP